MADTPTFAEILRIVGRGPKLSRSLTRAEANAAMAQIIDGQAQDAPELAEHLDARRHDRRTITSNAA